MRTDTDRASARGLRSELRGLGTDYAAPEGRHVLGAMTFGTRSFAALHPDGHPELGIRTASPGFDTVQEVWTTDSRPEHGTDHGLAFAHDGEYLYCIGHIPEFGVYQHHSRSAYESAFRLIDELGYPHIFRMWNFVGAINGNNAEGVEIYRDFVAGRAEAFASYGDGTGRMPAATGIGMHGTGIGFAFLACRSGAVRHIENHRQTPAYHYPQEYGPKPPSFARATRLLPGSAEDRGTLFVSGTASILGHETVHAGDVDQQCKVTLENIAELIGSANLSRSGLDHGYELTDLDSLKVYVRHPEHLPIVRAKCAEAFSARAGIAYLHADVCRSDLLVEIEGIVPDPTW
ncbi:FkbO/Hyg5 family chorismatase [Kitasatospora sp. GP82]|uniref:FkbO/Hyg5 family chorismatase n=1 Tax=Kitasatospora sp. GP82 TaxID=3035089 RepID=UPI002475EE80|nr:FkbO/Hyg5 family chorismatase [Kitasatospora sp. GP82]MDH6128161.1 chorismate lyase/3-hydroxybenzoate synthase [Kitasatospora sp. GP82]